MGSKLAGRERKRKELQVLGGFPPSASRRPTSGLRTTFVKPQLLCAKKQPERVIQISCRKQSKVTGCPQREEEYMWQEMVSLMSSHCRPPSSCQWFVHLRRPNNRCRTVSSADIPRVLYPKLAAFGLGQPLHLPSAGAPQRRLP